MKARDREVYAENDTQTDNGSHKHMDVETQDESVTDGETERQKAMLIEMKT